jgi:hypothetical protein
VSRNTQLSCRKASRGGSGAEAARRKVRRRGASGRRPHSDFAARGSPHSDRAAKACCHARFGAELPMPCCLTVGSPAVPSSRRKLSELRRFSKDCAKRRGPAPSVVRSPSSHGALDPRPVVFRIPDAFGASALRMRSAQSPSQKRAPLGHRSRIAAALRYTGTHLAVLVHKGTRPLRGGSVNEEKAV